MVTVTYVSYEEGGSRIKVAKVRKILKHENHINPIWGVIIDIGKDYDNIIHISDIVCFHIDGKEVITQ